MNRMVKKLMVVLLSAFMFMGTVTTPVQAKDTSSNNTGWGSWWGWWWPVQPTNPEPDPEITEEPVVEEEEPVVTEEPAEEETQEEEETPVIEEENSAVEGDSADEETPVIEEEPVVDETPADSELEVLPEETEVAYPEIKGLVPEEPLEGVDVTIDAPEGALPEGTTVEVKKVELSEVQAVVDQAADISGTVLAAFDITFYNVNGEKIEPVKGKEVEVRITAPEIADAENVEIVHIPDEAEPETVEQLDEETAEDEVAFASDQFSIYLIVDGDDSSLKTPRTTYYFLSELKADGTADPYSFVNKHGDYVDYQIVKNDELLEDPGSPAVSLEKNFLGWFVVDKNGDTYSFPTDATAIDFSQQPPVKATVTSGDLDVYVAPRFGEAFIVTFWDNAKGSPEDQMHIVAKRVVYLDEGSTSATTRVDNVPVPTIATQALTGWTSDDYKDGEQTTYTLLEKPSWDGITKSFNLYPIFSDGHWLRFSGGPSGSGAGYREAIFVTANTQASELASLGTITREGYTFAGWYYKGSEENPFDGTEATTNASGNTNNAADLLARVLNGTGDLTLYAHWTGNQVGYKVATWFENADDDEYSYGELTSSSGAAGTQTNVIATAVDGFTAEAIEQQEIKGDGTTIVNVYYKRNEYTIRFYNRNNEITDLRITAKYGADVHGEWPGVKEGTTNYSALWQVRNGNALVAGVSTMPLNGASYSQLSSGRYYQNTKLMTQNVDGSNNFTQYVERPFGYSQWLTTTVEDYTPIKGFSLNAASSNDATRIRNGAASDGSDPNATYNRNFRTSAAIGTSTQSGEQISQGGHTYRTLYFYYLRNQYSVSFNTLKSGAATPAPLENIYYEANIATTKSTEIAALNRQYVVDETTVEVTGEGTYVFKGWYDNADGMGDPFNFDQEMPAGNITLYAKWDRIWYQIDIDPRGGEILPSINEVTYTWLQYDQKIERYNIRRDYVEAGSDYTGKKYYYVSILSDDDPHVNDPDQYVEEEYRNTDGYIKSDYRKAFYVAEDEIDSLDSLFKRYVISDTVYKVATTDDNYSFVGWYNKATDKVYNFDDGIKGNTAIYAKWRRSGLFTIQYHTENGTVSSLIDGSLVASDSSYADQATTNIAYTPTHITSTDRKAYVFVGWKVADPNGFDAEDPGSATLKDTVYKQGDEFTVDSTLADSGHFIHLVAIYEPAESNPDTLPITTVTFNPNFPEGATGTGEIKKVEGVPLNTAIDLSKESFTIKLPETEDRVETIPVYTCNGYKQVGWNTKADGSGTAFKLNDTVGVDNFDPKDNTLYAMWDHLYFYVFHSSDAKLEAVVLESDKTYNLVEDYVADGYLYGGYFNKYINLDKDSDAIVSVKATAEKAADHKALVSGVDTYDGSSLKSGTTKFWDKKAARTAVRGDAVLGSGLNDGDVLFLKEVPSDYLKAYTSYVYDYNTLDVKSYFLLTGIDDSLYQSAGYYIEQITDNNKKTAKISASFSYKRRNDEAMTTIKAEQIFNVERGYLGICDVSSVASQYYEKGAVLTKPYWVTLDGVEIKNAASNRTVKFAAKQSDITISPEQ